MGAWLGRKTTPELKLGVCGEHGGDPDSIEFLARLRHRLRLVLALPRADRTGGRRPVGDQGAGPSGRLRTRRGPARATASGESRG